MSIEEFLSGIDKYEDVGEGAFLYVRDQLIKRTWMRDLGLTPQEEEIVEDLTLSYADYVFIAAWKLCEDHPELGLTATSAFLRSIAELQLQGADLLISSDLS